MSTTKSRTLEQHHQEVKKVLHARANTAPAQPVNHDEPPTLPKVKTPKAEKTKTPPTPRKPQLFGVHCGRVMTDTDGNRRYVITKTEHETMEAAFKDLGVLAAKFSGKDLRELILSFPKIKDVK